MLSRSQALCCPYLLSRHWKAVAMAQLSAHSLPQGKWHLQTFPTSATTALHFTGTSKESGTGWAELVSLTGKAGPCCLCIPRLLLGDEN